MNTWTKLLAITFFTLSTSINASPITFDLTDNRDDSIVGYLELDIAPSALSGSYSLNTGFLSLELLFIDLAPTVVTSANGSINLDMDNNDGYHIEGANGFIGFATDFGNIRMEDSQFSNDDIGQDIITFDFSQLDWLFSPSLDDANAATYSLSQGYALTPPQPTLPPIQTQPPSPMPEPSILALMGFGLFGLGLTRRKNK